MTRRAATTLAFAVLLALASANAASRKPPPLVADEGAAVSRKPPPAQPYEEGGPAPAGYKVVLVAGDRSLPVFDNAVRSMAARLRQRGLAAADIRRLSAAPAVVAREGARPASLDEVLDAIVTMAPGAGQGCLVFATSHGAPDAGLVLAATREVLDPAALDAALVRGCGRAPTVVVISACFSGIYAHAPMTRPNRVVLTAARPDRTSFGCGAGYTYTVYDRCLLDSLGGGGTWRQAHLAIRRCVAAAERRGEFEPSEPQAWFGSDVADLALPGAEAPR